MLNHYTVSFIPQNTFLRQNEQVLLFRNSWAMKPRLNLEWPETPAPRSSFEFHSSLEVVMQPGPWAQLAMKMSYQILTTTWETGTAITISQVQKLRQSITLPKIPPQANCRACALITTTTTTPLHGWLPELAEHQFLRKHRLLRNSQRLWFRSRL